jgi:glycosyltransferase involved in cell wall biosynthesis
MRQIPVSVLIPIRNEEANLPRCLESVRWADEILVVDSQSTDASATVARRYGAEVVQFRFNGVWPKKKNWALENLPFRHEWVLILDADEVMPPEAAVEIGRVVTTDGDGHAGFWIWNVQDMDEAVAWVKRCPNPMPGPSEIEIRPFYELSDLGM